MALKIILGNGFKEPFCPVEGELRPGCSLGGCYAVLFLSICKESTETLFYVETIFHGLTN